MSSTHSYAIMRWSKLKTEKQAKDATGHNHRQYVVTNADEQAPYPNVEFVNHAQRGYWELANDRIQEVVTRSVRDNAVRAMEVILSGSPEAFARDDNGRAADYSNHQWAKDNLDFLKKTFGEKNVVSFTLHQDEKTPHIHAIVVPITADNRLSAKRLFNPGTLRKYQTEYAECMKPHGMERGVEHSKAVHQPMKRFYGQQAQAIREAAPTVEPVPGYQPIEVKAPGKLQLFSLDKWAAEETARINAQVQSQLEQAVEQANQRVKAAQAQAREYAAAHDQVRTLQKQLHTVETSYQKIARANTDLAMRVAGGEAVPTDWLEKGTKLLDNELKGIKAGREEIVTLHGVAEKAEKQGDYGRVAELRYGIIPEMDSQQKAREDRFDTYAGGQERLAILNKEAQIRAEEQAALLRKQAEEAEKAREEAARQAAEARQAELARQAEQLRLAEAAKQRQLEEERLQRERAIQLAAEQKISDEKHLNQSFSEILKAKGLVGINSLIDWAEEYRIVVLDSQDRELKNVKNRPLGIPEAGELRFRVEGHATVFSERDLQPNGQPLRPQLNSVSRINLDRVLTQQAKDRSLEMD